VRRSREALSQHPSRCPTQRPLDNEMRAGAVQQGPFSFKRLVVTRSRDDYLVAALPSYYFIAKAGNLAPDVGYSLASCRHQADGGLVPGRCHQGSVGSLATNGNGCRSIRLPTWVLGKNACETATF
jgi:hypothetical protein